MLSDFRLQVFHAVARRLSFTKAAEELYITQPAVTKHIRMLEQQLNTTLFERRGNSIALTESGRIVQQYAEQIQHIYRDLEQEINLLSGTVNGRLHIGASTTIAQYILPEILAAFHKDHTEVQLQITSGNTGHIEQALLDGTIDLGFIEGPARNKQIKYIPFCGDELVLTAKAGHVLADGKQRTPAELQQASFVMREHGSGTLEVVLGALKKEGVNWPQLQTALRLDSTEAIKSYLLHSDCLAFISVHALPPVQTVPLFTIIPVDGLQITRPLHAIHLQGEPGPLAAVFLKYALRYNKRLSGSTISDLR